jgi:hypothetical protein
MSRQPIHHFVDRVFAAEENMRFVAPEGAQPRIRLLAHFSQKIRPANSLWPGRGAASIWS